MASLCLQVCHRDALSQEAASSARPLRLKPHKQQSLMPAATNRILEGWYWEKRSHQPPAIAVGPAAGSKCCLLL